MTQQTDLFRDLSHRLCDFAEAAVLLALLSNHADVTEYKTTSVKMSLDRLEGMVPRLGVQRALKRLKARGLINIRIQPNTATLVRVDREAVLALLRKPMPDHIPGNDDYHFPFLDAWAADKAANPQAAPSWMPAADQALSGVAQECVEPVPSSIPHAATSTENVHG
ncbi:MAG: hypothetical protein ACLGJD_09435 [Gammaproteobacteria bacterium]|uniref:hypothetical protein n=1 Tax=uncultured Pseudacidovorax sp. TaxID=679313 RepID=UPI0025D8E11C|nr:hypothetical protein [uncultured Pseudacidovorax sp.]